MNKTRICNHGSVSLRGAFTLIELMIVVAIIAIVLAIAIPSLMGSKKSGNETSAIGSLRTLRSSNEQYKTRYRSFASSLANLNTSGFIDSVIASGTKSGYRISYVGATDTWSASAVPVTAGTTGDRGFYIDSTGVVRFVASGSATSSSPPMN